MGESKKRLKKANKRSRNGKLSRLGVCDLILANLMSGKSVMPTDRELDKEEIQVSYNAAYTEQGITKFYLVKNLPDYLAMDALSSIRNKCLVSDGVKINLYVYTKGHKIDWQSSEMQGKMGYWREYTDDAGKAVSVFDYRKDKSTQQAKIKMLNTVRYLNMAELDDGRSLLLASFVLQISCAKGREYEMVEVVERLGKYASNYGLQLRELNTTLRDWLKMVFPLSLRDVSTYTQNKLSKRLLTDDILASLDTFRQGKVGKSGVVLGLDVVQGSPVLHDYKKNPTEASNCAIVGETGSGKSYFVKGQFPYMLGFGNVVLVNDYEGDEYTNIANYIASGNPDDALVITLGSGTGQYFDPCYIGELTGNYDIDKDLKANAIKFIMAMLRIMIKDAGDLTKDEKKVLSVAIQRVYDNALVTDEPSSWVNSKDVKLEDIYREIKFLEETREFLQGADEGLQRAVESISYALSLYFEQGEVYYGSMSKPVPIDKLYKARFIVFSFGMKGEVASVSDNTMLKLKQCSVAYISTLIANHSFYVRKCYTMIVWEEYQRWGEIEGSEEIILNVFTGGRKRGIINMLVTNNMAALLDKSNIINAALVDNIQMYCIGSIKSEDNREKFCQQFGLKDSLFVLNLIANASNSESAVGSEVSRYKHSFCVILKEGDRSVCKVSFPKSVAESKLYETGKVTD